MTSGIIEPPLVDSHAHIYTRDMPISETAWHRPAADAPLEQFLAVLDQAGVGFAVLAAASIFGEYNDYQIAATRRHSRLRTTIIARPNIDPYALRVMQTEGVVGIRFQWRNLRDIPDLSSPDYRLLLRRAADLDWHIQVHDDGWRLPPVVAAIEASGAKLVIDHFGRPDPKKGINCDGFKAVLRAVDRGRTWVKLSAGFRLEAPGLAAVLAAELLKSAGTQRLFWGSDWPFAAFESTMTYETAVRDFMEWVPDPRDRRAISRAALRFYFGRDADDPVR